MEGSPSSDERDTGPDADTIDPMRASEVVGGLSVIGVLALIGLAIADDADSGTITTATAPTILAPLESTVVTEPVVSVTSTSVAESEATEPPVETESTDPPATSPASTDTTTTTTTTTIATIPVEERTDIRVRAVNAGGPAGSAAFTSGILEGEGFDPEGPADGVVGVDQNMIFFAPGQEIAAATVNQFVNFAPEFVIAANPDDPNWAEFAPNLDVLVLVGPQ